MNKLNIVVAAAALWNLNTGYAATIDTEAYRLPPKVYELASNVLDSTVDQREKLFLEYKKTRATLLKGKPELIAKNADLAISVAADIAVATDEGVTKEALSNAIVLCKAMLSASLVHATPPQQTHRKKLFDKCTDIVKTAHGTAKVKKEQFLFKIDKHEQLLGFSEKHNMLTVANTQRMTIYNYALVPQVFYKRIEGGRQ